MEPDFKTYFYRNSEFHPSDEMDFVVKKIIFAIEKNIYEKLVGLPDWKAKYIGTICGSVNNPVWLWNVGPGDLFATERMPIWNKYWELIQGAINLHLMNHPRTRSLANLRLIDFDPIFERFHAWGPMDKPSSPKLKF